MSVSEEILYHRKAVIKYKRIKKKILCSKEENKNLTQESLIFDLKMAAQPHKQPNLEEVEAFLKNVQVQILEQPAENKHRFRYKSEGRATGTLLGESSSDEIKTYPKLKVIGYQVKKTLLLYPE